jgi:hypothetical protein
MGPIIGSDPRFSGPLQRTILMMRKFAIALIATTMLVAPALAADAGKSTQGAPVAAAITTAPASKHVTKTVSKTKTATKRVAKTEKHGKTFKVAHRHAHHMTVAKNGHSGHVKTAKVSKPVKIVTATPAPAPMTWFAWPAIKTDTKAGTHLKTVKVAHHHAHHMTVAKNGHSSHVKTAKVSKPATTAAPIAATAAKPAVKVIKANKDIKKIKVAHRHSVHHQAIAKGGKATSHVKTAQVSKPVKHADVRKPSGQIAHVAKSNKVIAN